MVDSLARTGIAAHIAVIDGQPTTTTQDIADVYGKRHDHVLRIVRQRMAEAPEEWRLPNFGETVIERANPSGGAPIQSPVIRMTKKGFHFVVGKFTGAKAVQHQIAFADEFERMEGQIAGLGNSANPGGTPGVRPSIASTPNTAPPQRWLMELDAQGRPQVKALSAGAHMLRAADIGKMLLQKDSPFSNAEVLQIAEHANTRMFIDVANLQSASELEHLRKTVRTLCASDLTEIAKQAWLELSLRTGKALGGGV